MRKIAVIFESSPFDRKGLFNAVHNRTKHLSASGEFEVDAFCMHIKDSLLSRKLRKTPKVPKVESVEVDGISYKMMWRGFSYVDELRRRMSSAPKKLLTYAARQARLFKDYDILVAHSYEAGLVAYEAHRLFGMPYTVTWHGSDVHTHPIKDEARRTLTARIMEKAAVNFFVSANLLETSEKITENAVKSVLYNGVSEGYEKFDDETRAAYRANYGLESDDKVVAYVGNLHPVKNVEILPDLFSRIHDNFEMHLRDCPENQANLKFWVVGDGKLRSQIEPVVMKTAGAQVYFWGNLETGRMSALMHCIDLLVLPSKNEGLPLVTLEALSCGASVLGSDVGGIPEVIGKEFCVPFDVKNDGTIDYMSDSFVEKMSQKAVKQLFYPKEQTLDPRFSWEQTAKTEIGILKGLNQ